MATTQQPAAPEQRIVLYDVSWETYERLLANYEGKSSPRFTYDRGVLEIVSPTYPHEKVGRALAAVVEMVADELGIDVEDAGSTTFRKQDLQRGFEADASFYIEHAAHVVGKLAIDLGIDPPPDLIIEIDVTNPSLDKLPVFAALGVPEVWRYVDATGRVAILRLDGDVYRASPKSLVLPPLTSHALTWMAEARLTSGRSAWKTQVQQWIRDHSRH